MNSRKLAVIAALFVLAPVPARVLTRNRLS